MLKLTILYYLHELNMFLRLGTIKIHFIMLSLWFLYKRPKRNQLGSRFAPTIFFVVIGNVTICRSPMDAAINSHAIVICTEWDEFKVSYFCSIAIIFTFGLKVHNVCSFSKSEVNCDSKVLDKKFICQFLTRGRNCHSKFC